MIKLRWVLSQYDWGPYKTREIWTQKRACREEDRETYLDKGHAMMEAKELRVVASRS